MNILTIGNSFTDSLALYFPAAVQSARCDLHFERANFGGCELARHWSYIEAEERDVRCRIYQGGRKLRSILELRAWDVVTIQQASHDSWRPETFQPWAGNIIAYVKKHAPRAEVVIQQTWAYRADHPQLLPGSEWGISQDEMYERLTANYTKLARDYKLRIIPSGYAVQLTRRNSERKFANYDPALIDTLAWPDLPPQAEAPEAPTAPVAPAAQPAGATRVTSGQLPPYVLRPVSYEDVQSVVRRVRTNQPVVVVFRNTNIETAKRILDFCFGFSYGVNGEVTELGDRVFAVLPAGVTLSSADIDKLVADGDLVR